MQHHYMQIFLGKKTIKKSNGNKKENKKKKTKRKEKSKTEKTITRF